MPTENTSLKNTTSAGESNDGASRNDKNNIKRLRQRTRSRIINDKKEDKKIEVIVRQSIVNNSRYSGHFIRTFLVVITALLCTVVAIIQSKPKFFDRLLKRNSIPTFHLATKYPNTVILDRDLPRIFGFYSIATPENVFAQKAVRRVCNSRTQLRRRAGRIKTIVKAWDVSNIENVVNQEICGHEFVTVYRSDRISQQRKDDLLMWCLMATRATEGFFMESIDIIDSPLILTRNRGIVVLKQTTTAAAADGYAGELSTAFYLHPRTDKTKMNWIPSKILAMLISSSQEEHEEEKNADVGSTQQEMVQKLLYDLVITQENEKDFLILEEVCQENRPERSIAIDTKSSNDNCYFVLPEKYGGNFNSIREEK